MKMMECPQWHSCSAAFCPLQGGGGVHIKGDAVCYYLREFVKENAKANFNNAGISYIYEDLKPLIASIVASSVLIRKELTKASKTNSRLARTPKKTAETTTDGAPEIDRNNSETEGAYGTVETLQTTSPITEEVYSPIHPLAGAANGIREAGLTGDRNRCPTCLEYFNSSKAFDQHRTGKFNGRRRCLTIAEMQNKNLSKNREGFWLSPVLEKDRERLALLRATKS